MSDFQTPHGWVRVGPDRWQIPRERISIDGAPCTYSPQHRYSDWQRADGGTVCGVCHPKPPAKEEQGS